MSAPEPTATDPTPTVPPAEAAPTVAGPPVVKQTERPHPLTPFIRGWLVLVAIGVTWLQQLPRGEDDFGSDDLPLVLAVVAGVVLVAGLVGLVTWWFTRFVIDDEELRLETGAVFKSSKRVPFERLQSVDVIQPFAARLFGLAELRIEVGAGDSTLRLRYLTRAKAGRLREYLLARAHGGRERITDADLAAPASAFTDLGRADRPLVTVPPQRLVGAFLLSNEWLVSAGLAVLALGVTTWFGVTAYALPGLVPLLIGAVTMVGRRVVSMYNFTLAESARGLRITRGLANLASQSVPVDRIQGVKICQPWLWKPFGWYRLDVDIVGYARTSEDKEGSSASSTLLPVADAPQVAATIDRVLPGFRVPQVPLHPSPWRARWVRWFDWWTLRYGWDDRALVTQHGWLHRVTDVVPHAKSQSVRIEQGPLQRRLRLADVHVDTPRGPVTLVAHQLDVAVARELAMSQLDRARSARAADRTRLAAPPEQRVEAELLAAFGTDRDALLGAGGESEVFAVGDDRVLRLYRSGHQGPATVARQLQVLTSGWDGLGFPVELPRVLEVGERAGRVYSVDRRFSGRPLAGWLASTGDVDERHRALASLLDVAGRLHRLPAPGQGFCGLLGPDALTAQPTLGALLASMLAGPVGRARSDLDADLPEASAVWSRLMADLAERVVQPALVHGDVGPGNAYVSRGPAGPVVSGLGDFSPHTVRADPVMDLTGATAFLELEPYDGAADDARWLTDLALERYRGSALAQGDLAHWLVVYRRFYGFYFADAHAFDERLYGWCLAQLRR